MDEVTPRVRLNRNGTCAKCGQIVSAVAYEDYGGCRVCNDPLPNSFVARDRRYRETPFEEWAAQVDEIVCHEEREMSPFGAMVFGIGAEMMRRQAEAFAEAR